MNNTVHLFHAMMLVHTPQNVSSTIYTLLVLTLASLFGAGPPDNDAEMLMSLPQCHNALPKPVKTLQGLGMLDMSVVTVDARVQCFNGSVVQRRA